MNSRNLNPAVSVQPAASRIVVIEDDPAILRGLEAALCSQSYDVLTAVDGETGYRLVRDRQPDLVILDLMLPENERLRDLPASSPAWTVDADPDAHRAGSGIQPCSGIRCGRRRLCHQAVFGPRTARARQGDTSPIRRPRRPRESAGTRRSATDPATADAGGDSATSRIPDRRDVDSARITSGDYFDVFRLDGNALAICIADVCGKGMPAAMIMSNLQAAVRSHASREMSPRDLCGQLNRLMCRNIASQGFITCLYAVIESGAEADHLLQCGTQSRDSGYRGIHS